MIKKGKTKKQKKETNTKKRKHFKKSCIRVSENIRNDLINLVAFKSKKIKEAATLLNINYSTAKALMRKSKRNDKLKKCSDVPCYFERLDNSNAPNEIIVRTTICQRIMNEVKFKQEKETLPPSKTCTIEYKQERDLSGPLKSCQMGIEQNEMITGC